MGGIELDEWDSEREGGGIPTATCMFHRRSTLGNDTAESTAPEKWSFIFGFQIFWPKLVACVNNGPKFPSNLTHAAAEGGDMVKCPGFAAVPPPHDLWPPAKKTLLRRVYALCARNDPSFPTNFIPDRQSLRRAMG